MTDQQLNDVGENGEENKTNCTDETEDVVTPWDVSTLSATGINYDKLIGLIIISSIMIFNYCVQIVLDAANWTPIYWIAS
jgi:hypothetical protein